jgi:hypothetical protein
MAFELVRTLATASVGGVVGYLIRYVLDRSVKRFVTDRQTRNAWHFLQEPTHVFMPLANTIEAGTVAVYEDFLAAALIVTLAERSFASARNVRIHTNEADFARVLGEHLIIIGGGHFNPVYRKAIERLEVPLHFFDTEADNFVEIRNKDRSSVYKPAGDNNKLVYDVGFAVRARNPWNRERSIIIVAGSYGYGTVAAMRYITEPSTLGDLRKYLDRNCEIIVKAAISEGEIVSIERISNIITW